MEFDAVSIEYAFARLLGSEIGARGTDHDADVFRGGRRKNLAVALSKAADAIESRVGALTFAPTDSEAGGIKARLTVAIGRLRRIAATMAASGDAEPSDYHWEIIGCLVSTTTALLETLERYGAQPRGAGNAV